MKTIIRKTILIVIQIMLLILVGCSKDEEQSNINLLSFELSNIQDSTILYLWDRNDVIDSTIITNGKGFLKFSTDKPKSFVIRNNGSGLDYRYKYLWLEPSDIKISGDYNQFRNVQIIGSKSEDISSIYLMAESEYKKDIDSLTRIKENSENEDVIIKLENQISVRRERYTNDLVSSMKKQYNTYVTLSWLSWQCTYNSLSKEDILDVYNHLTNEFKLAELGQSIKHFTELPETPRIGDKYIDFIQYTPNRDTIRLSDYLGKITLVEFWGSGCYPCRVENPKLVETYKKYNPQGFEILGVSDDVDIKRWVKAIEQDRLPWINVSDLKGRFNEAMMIYGIIGTPNNILLNENGIITHKNLRGTKLDEVLVEIFDQKSS